MAQKISVDPGVDIANRYIWRGLNLGGSSPAIQPSIKLNAGKLTIGTWGSFAMDNEIKLQETDLFATCNFTEELSVTVTDYFFPLEQSGNNNYFETNQDSTAHILEASISFSGKDKFPFSFIAAMNFWGADAKTASNKNQYSTYFEAGYNFTVKETTLKLFIGGSPNSPDSNAGETGFYGKKAGITNFGITAAKKIEMTEKFSLPVTTSFIINPQTENVFLIVGITL